MTRMFGAKGSGQMADASLLIHTSHTYIHTYIADLQSREEALEPKVPGPSHRCLSFRGLEHCPEMQDVLSSRTLYLYFSRKFRIIGNPECRTYSLASEVSQSISR